MKKNIEEICKDISLAIIPIQDRQVILELVILHLQESVECNASFVMMADKHNFINQHNININDLYPNYDDVKNYFFNCSDIVTANEVKCQFNSLFSYYKPIINENSLFLPIHSFEELQAIILLVPVGKTSFSETAKNAFAMLLYYLIVAFDRITQIERLEASLSSVKEKNKYIESLNFELENKVCEEINKSNKAFKLIEEMSYNTMLTNLNAGIAHEINNPLTIMQLDAEFMGSYELSSKDNGQLNDYVISIQKNISKIKDITSTLIKYGLARSNEKKLIDLAEVINDISLMVNGYIKRHQITLLIENTLSESTILGDQVRVYQVLMNLIQNSFNALRDTEYKKIHIVLSKSIRNGSSVLDVVLKDNGCGMKSDEIKRLFEPKVKQDRDGAGLGLGLSIVKTIMDDHNASINVESVLNKGTSITLKFKQCF